MAKNLAQHWPIRNDQIVLMVLAGITMSEVGKQFGLTKQAISVIVNDPRAEEVIRTAQVRLREKIISNVEDSLDDMTQLAVAAVRRTLQADLEATSKAKPNQDRVALKLLSGRGFLRVEDKSGEGGFQVSPDQFLKLTEALRKSDEAKSIDPFEGQEVIEAEVIEDA